MGEDPGQEVEGVSEGRHPASGSGDGAGSPGSSAASWASQGAHWHRTHLPVQETWEPPVRCLGPEDSPGAGNGTPLQCCYLENPMDRGAWGLQSMGSQRVRHNLLAVQGSRLHVSTAGGMRSVPGRRTKIPHAEWPKVFLKNSVCLTRHREPPFKLTTV